jgi:pilus assembly protein Flp/PilA
VKETDMLAYIRKVTEAKNDEGASAVEYGLLIAAIAAVIIGVVFAIGVFVDEGFTQTCDELAANPNSTSTQTC